MSLNRNLGAQKVKLYLPPRCFHREAIDQKFSRKEGVRANQLMNAIAVAVSKLPQWFSAQMFRSLSIRTVMPADEHAAPKMSAAVIPSPIANRQTARRFLRQRLTSNA